MELIHSVLIVALVYYVHCVNPLSLGGSRCIPCTMHNIYMTEILLIAPIVGIAIIALMLILKLTVDKGTLNGLTFYANIIGANSSIFFPSSFTTNPLQGLYVFIS